MGRRCLCLGVRRGFVGLFGAFSGHVSLGFAVEAASLLFQFLLMFGKGAPGLGGVYFHGDRIVP